MHDTKIFFFAFLYYQNYENTIKLVLWYQYDQQRVYHNFPSKFNNISGLLHNSLLLFSHILNYYPEPMMTSINGINQSIDDTSQNFDEIKGIDIAFKNINVSAEIEDEESMRFYHFGCCKPMVKKQILFNASGEYKAGRLHALMGPSGSGKTTLINALMGQSFSKNVEVYGQLFVNKIRVKNLSDIGDQLGYVRQDDLMFPFFTPKETFQFYLNMKQHSKTPQEKKKIINNLIIILGLNDCQDTYIGNSMHKGLSGGEKRRTSIGIELITDPSIIFLDQPTTGLDSSTALKLILTLKQLARTGKNIITTMHQPSSNIFMQLDFLTLIVDGHIVYNGEACDSVQYFQKLYKMKISKHENPLDIFMSFLTKQGIAIRFFGDKQCDENELTQKYNKNIKKLLKHHLEHSDPVEIQQQQSLKLKDLDINKTNKPHAGRQVWYLLMRILVNTFRNRNKMFWKFFSFAFIISFLMTVLFYEKADNFYQYDTNISILAFFYCFMISFLAVFDETINFSTDRAIFIRESLNNYYLTSAYCCANFLGSIPLNVIVISLTWTPSYWVLSTNHEPRVFFLCLLLIILLYVMIMRVCLILAILIPSQLALNMLLPILLVSFSLAAGFFIPLNNLSDAFKPLQIISCIKYAYQAFIQLQYQDGNSQIDEYLLKPQLPLQQNRYQFSEPLWLNFVLIVAIGLVFGFLDYVALRILGSAYKINISEQPETNRTQKTIKTQEKDQKSKKQIPLITIKTNQTICLD